jgi:hypothetical protein
LLKPYLLSAGEGDVSTNAHCRDEFAFLKMQRRKVEIADFS